LQLPAVCVTNVMPAETHHQITGQHHDCYVAICTGCGRADKRYVSRRFEKQARVLGLTDCIFVYQHDDLALVNVTLPLRNLLRKRITCAVSQIRVGETCGLQNWPREEGRHHVLLFSKTRSDGPGRAVWVTAHIEDNSRRPLDGLKHLVNFACLQTIEICIA